ncbi:MAG: hypothetical protein V1777_04425 [Candidatus Micrarchaeota archaeon]
MQTVLQWGKKRSLDSRQAEVVVPFSYYLEQFGEWKELRGDPGRNAERLKHFESLHGKAFIESLFLFEKVVGD